MLNMASMASPWKPSIKFLCRTFKELRKKTSQMQDDDSIQQVSIYNFWMLMLFPHIFFEDTEVSPKMQINVQKS